MRRLSDYQAVSVYVAGARFDARVAASADGLVWLAFAQGAPAPEGLPTRMELGFDRDGRLALVAGWAEEDALGCLLFHADDPRPLRNLRATPRLELPLPAVVTPTRPDGERAGAAHELLARDLSAGGCAVETAALGGRGTRVHVALSLPGTGGVVEAGGTIVRVEAGVSGIAFSVVEAADRDRIDRFVLAARLAVSRRFDESERDREHLRRSLRGPSLRSVP